MASAAFDLAAAASDLVGALRRLAPDPVDPSPVIVTRRPFYGARVGDLRALARRWLREHPGVAPGQVAALADELWGRGVREEMLLAAFLHGHDAATRNGFGARRVDRWARLLDTWETTDQLGQSLVGPWVADDPPTRIGVLEELGGRSNPWVRRLSLVGCVALGRRTDAASWWPRVAGLLLDLSGDREAAIPKAISWVLREHLRHIPDEVVEFVDTHAGALPAVAVREVRRKVAGGRTR